MKNTVKIDHLSKKEIRRNLAAFEKGLAHSKDEGREPLARYASFDYCFNYFQGYKNKKELSSKENIQNSCLHLAFYLASWGMLRGSSFLLNKSIKFYEPLIKYISAQDEDFWKIDVQNYTEESIKKLIECSDNINKILSDEGRNKVSDTLVTKIMLGVFGNVPAFDAYFKIGSGLNTFNKRSLISISDLYSKAGYSELISDEARRIKTFDYDTGKAGSRPYTKAKIIDMIFFVEGYKKGR